MRNETISNAIIITDYCDNHRHYGKQKLEAKIVNLFAEFIAVCRVYAILHG
jgi:hypothetical protein